MGGILSKLKALVTKPFKWLHDKLSPARRKIILDAASNAVDLMEFALPAMKVVAAFTKDNQMDDKLVEALEVMGKRADEILVEDEHVRDGLVLALAVEVTKLYIADAIAAAVPDHIKIGTMDVTAPHDVPKRLLRAAVDYAYGVIFSNMGD